MKKSLGNLRSFSVMKALMGATPVGVSMLVYINLASVENSLAALGSSISFRLFMTLNDFLCVISP